MFCPLDAVRVALDIRGSRRGGVDPISCGGDERSIEQETTIEEEDKKRGGRVLWDGPGLYLRASMHDQQTHAEDGRPGEGHHAQHVRDGLRRVGPRLVHRGVPAGGVHEHAPGAGVERGVHHEM